VSFAVCALMEAVTHDNNAVSEGCLAHVVIVGLVKPAVEPRNLADEDGIQVQSVTNSR
jgi:hypothetical protein